jgi:crossover junction endodeoxyribonuclease RuvC
MGNYISAIEHPSTGRFDDPSCAAGAKRYAGGMEALPSTAPPVTPAWRVLGVDPGLQITGYGVLEARPRGPFVCEAGVLSSAEGRASTDLAGRLRILYDGIVEVVEQFRPAAVAVEQLFAHYDHPRTAILMAHARGVILLAAAQRGLPVISYAATGIKKAITGSGRASKEQMQHAIQRELGLAQLPEPPDVADALAAALCHYHVHRRPGEAGR